MRSWPARSRASIIQRELAETYRVAGDVEKRRLGKPAAATEFHGQGPSVGRKNWPRQNPFLVQLQADVAAIYLKPVGQLQLQTAAPTDALAWFTKARDIQQRLVDDDPTITQFQIDLALAMLNIGASADETTTGQLVDTRTDLEHAPDRRKRAVDTAADRTRPRATLWLAASLAWAGSIRPTTGPPTPWRPISKRSKCMKPDRRLPMRATGRPAAI